MSANIEGPILRALFRDIDSKRENSDDRDEGFPNATHTSPNVTSPIFAMHDLVTILSTTRNSLLLHVNTLCQRFPGTRWMVKESQEYSPKHII